MMKVWCLNLLRRVFPGDQQLYSKVWKITVPAFVELVMSNMFTMINMMMLSQYSTDAVAAVGLTGQPNMLLMACFAAINVGATTLIAWNIGAGNPAEARKATRQTLLVNFSLGILVTLIGFAVSRTVVEFMAGGGLAESTMALGTNYFRIIICGLLFQEINMAITASLRGSGQTRQPMVYNILTNLINVVLNFFLIYGNFGFPEMGALGAATATTISRFLGCLMALYVVMNPHTAANPIHVSFRESWKPDFSIIKQILNIGGPATLEQFILQSGFVLFARTVSPLGETVFSAHQIGLNINSMAFMPSQAFGVAATTLVGQSLGENNPKQAKSESVLLFRMSMCVACLVGVFFMTIPVAISRLYTSDPAVLALTPICLRVIALAMPGLSTQQAVSGSLRGAGDTIFPMMASVLGVWVFRVVVCHVLVTVLNLGLMGAWISMFFDQYLRATVVYLRHRGEKWLSYKQRRMERAAKRAA
ncbi:MAG: MATE family efflux transporter [Christensenellaceae bacterium]|jgi:putative MATE family efflux protein|nr:MATE family efflux transporter [Christensenellaceae bacterium]